MPCFACSLRNALLGTLLYPSACKPKRHSIRRIKLRREAATNSFRGSVYIEFADAASAHAAVNSPPRQPHGTQLASGSSQRFHVMMKTDYERKRANANSSAGGRDGGSMGAGRDGNSAAHKRARHRSDGPTISSQREPPPPPPPPPPLPPGHQHGVMPVSAPEQSYQQAQQWKQVVDEREAVVRALEESLRKEREDNQRLYHRLEEVRSLHHLLLRRHIRQFGSLPSKCVGSP